MKKPNIIIISCVTIIILIAALFLLTGRARTDVYLTSYQLSKDENIMTLNVATTSSHGYIRKMKRTSGSMNYYFTFYSTLGINTKLGSKNTFKIELDADVDEIYFFTGNKGYKKVLEKTPDGKWVSVSDKDISSTCNHKPNLIVTQKDYKVYGYCLDNEKITINNKEYIVKEYLKNNNDKASIQNLIKSLKYEGTFDDGGTKIYKGDVVLIACNTLVGNKDIYVGNKNMTYKHNFCKENNNTFVRTYLIESIKSYTKQQYKDGIPVSYGNSFEVKLSQFQGKTTTVIINNLWKPKLEKGKNYEFEFMLEDNSLKKGATIEEIFKKSYIVEVRETNKIGGDQLQESIA